MINALASDIAVSWLGALGCLLCCRFLWNAGESGPLTRAGLLLIGTLTLLLSIRGFFWLFGGWVLGRAVFAAATLLPLVATIFVECLLRRHHPMWLKLLAIGTTGIFFFINVAVNLAEHQALVMAFAGCFTLVLAGNGLLLARVAHADLTRNERQFARAILLVAIFAVPLVVTDFREQLGFPVRLGALGALLLVYVVLGLADYDDAARELMRRMVVAALAACLLAFLFAIVLSARRPDLFTAFASALPLSMACTLVAAIFIRILAASSNSEASRFLRWLLRARLETTESFVYSLKHFPQMAQHSLLTADQLRSYSLDLLFELASDRREPISLAEARALVRQGRSIEAAEQLVDLLERNEMTHALLIRRDPPLAVLVNLPEGAHNAVGQARAGVIQRLARRLAELEPRS